MATLDLQTTELRLSKSEQASLKRSLRDLVSHNSKQRTTELSESFRRTRRFGNMLGAELRRVGVDVEKLRRFANQEYMRLDKAFVARVKGRRERRSRRRGGPPDAVWGLTSGSAKPPHDFFETKYVIHGSPSAGNFRHIADKMSGDLEVYAHAHDARPEMVQSWAAVGFWYIPNRVGVLSVSIAAPLEQHYWTSASWNDAAVSGAWISLGIARWLREPFRFVDWSAINPDRLWWSASHWFEGNDTYYFPLTPYSMSVSSLVDTSHYYACWAWIEAFAYGKDGGGYAGSSLKTTIGSFTYNLV